MESKITESEKLWINKLIESGDFSSLEEWMGDDPDKAKVVFSLYRSLRALGEMEGVMVPALADRIQYGSDKVKRLVIDCLQKGLHLVVGEEYLLHPDVGWVRSDDASDNASNNASQDAMDFGNFKVLIDDSPSSSHPGRDKCYRLQFKPSRNILVEERAGKSIYQGNKTKEFTLPLFSGAYRIIMNGETWEIELK